MRLLSRTARSARPLPFLFLTHVQSCDERRFVLADPGARADFGTHQRHRSRAGRARAGRGARRGSRRGARPLPPHPRVRPIARQPGGQRDLERAAPTRPRPGRGHESAADTLMPAATAADRAIAMSAEGHRADGEPAAASSNTVVAALWDDRARGPTKAKTTLGERCSETASRRARRPSPTPARARRCSNGAVAGQPVPPGPTDQPPRRATTRASGRRRRSGLLEAGHVGPLIVEQEGLRPTRTYRCPCRRGTLVPGARSPARRHS
jgi:hypothetical protein